MSKIQFYDKSISESFFDMNDKNLPQNMSDSELISYSLKLYSNFIETGDFLMSAIDAEKSGNKIKALSIDQHKLVVRLNELADKIKNRKK